MGRSWWTTSRVTNIVPTRLPGAPNRQRRPDAHAVESTDLHETDGVTKLTNKLAFRDKAGRDHMTRSDGAEDSFDKMEDYLRSLLDPGRRRLSVGP
jgi:hypothetical protein